ncbi:sperm-associated antigen 4 protein [Perognathus longimembris pacificus]|uniref:sperm-associated antigen 4 protein n=1 Tax=Perognathus longimembris pacificus TaxID=214514 RepID=UPI002019CDAD|nr:sperm-associated antigen 4 protein [Perognathus longimembris pacificus]
MRRSPRPGSTASPHKHTPNFYSDHSNSSQSVTSRDSSGHRSAGLGPGKFEGRRTRGSSCGEPASTPGMPAGASKAGSFRPKPAPRSHNGQTARGAATVRGGASEFAEPPVVSEEQQQLDLLSTLDLRPEMPPPRVSKSFLSLLFQVLSVLLSVAGDALVSVYREVCSIRFLFTAVSLLGIFLAALWWGLLYLVPPLENEPKEMLTLSEYHERVRSQGQQLQQLQAELHKLHKEMSSVRAAHSERVAKLVFQRLNEDFVRKPDYALSSVGASIDLEKTSHDYEDTNTAYFWSRFSFWNYARPPSVILEPDVFPGNCWAFEGDQGQVVIRLPGHVQLSDITLQHPPISVAHTGGANSAPRDFSVFGLQVDDETEVFLGKFTFDVQKSEIQTFHLQNDPPSAFPKVKIQILSNWGHPRFTCLYRVRAHGVRTSEGMGESVSGATGGPH